MKKAFEIVLLVSMILIAGLPGFSPEVSALSGDYKSRFINSFESNGIFLDDYQPNWQTWVEEWTPWGYWNEWVSGATADCLRGGPSCHGAYSVTLWANTGDISSMQFNSNNSRGIAPFDVLTIYYRAHESTGGTATFNVTLSQLNASGDVFISNSEDLSITPGYDWVLIEIYPIWDVDTVTFALNFTTEQTAGSYASFLAIDYFLLHSEPTNIRFRFWNTYSGFGYYGEKLLARYYDYSIGNWVDVWQNEFDAYKGDYVLIKVTDIFDRSVYVGNIYVNSSPVYVDLLVPIITVIISKPSFWNDSLPWEWRITNLPWGPNGPSGMSLPAIGYEFEVLAGWYNFEWFQTMYNKAGNVSIYIDGNISEHRSYMLTDITIPMEPEERIILNQPTLNFANFTGFIEGAIELGTAILKDPRVAIVLGISGVIGLLYWISRGTKKTAEIVAERAAKQQAKETAQTTAKREARRTIQFGVKEARKSR